MGSGAMSVGDVKGKIMDADIMKKKPAVMVELGAWIGYSTVRFARCIGCGKLYSVDPEPMGHAIKSTPSGIESKTARWHLPLLLPAESLV
jgi:predicted O-methyltransferase YrrM